MAANKFVKDYPKQSGKTAGRRPLATAGSRTSQSPAGVSAWESAPTAWRPLGELDHELGFQLTWHEIAAGNGAISKFVLAPNRLGICLNLEGHGKLMGLRQATRLAPQCGVFYFNGAPPIAMERPAGENHCFVTLEFLPEFLQSWFGKLAGQLHPLIQSVVRGEARESLVAEPGRLLSTLQQLAASLRDCPASGPAQGVWFQAKALEIAAHLFFLPSAGERLCTRTQRLAQARVEKAKAILRERLQEPPSLEELAKMVSCSPFYLSRQFAQEGGATMQQYLRQVRMERAAELLRTGQCNVTEAALEVGYNSLSHFSSTFHATFGCCPGLYPLRCQVAAGQRRPASDAGPAA